MTYDVRKAARRLAKHIQSTSPDRHYQAILEALVQARWHGSLSSTCRYCDEPVSTEDAFRVEYGDIAHADCALKQSIRRQAQHEAARSVGWKPVGEE